MPPSPQRVSETAPSPVRAGGSATSPRRGRGVAVAAPSDEDITYHQDDPEDEELVPPRRRRLRSDAARSTEATLRALAGSAAPGDVAQHMHRANVAVVAAGAAAARHAVAGVVGTRQARRTGTRTRDGPASSSAVPDPANRPVQVVMVPTSSSDDDDAQPMSPRTMHARLTTRASGSAHPNAGAQRAASVSPVRSHASASPTRGASQRARSASPVRATSPEPEQPRVPRRPAPKSRRAATAARVAAKEEQLQEDEEAMDLTPTEARMRPLALSGEDEDETQRPVRRGRKRSARRAADNAPYNPDSHDFPADDDDDEPVPRASGSHEYLTEHQQQQQQQEQDYMLDSIAAHAVSQAVAASSPASAPPAAKRSRVTGARRSTAAAAATSAAAHSIALAAAQAAAAQAAAALVPGAVVDQATINQHAMTAAITEIVRGWAAGTLAFVVDAAGGCQVAPAEGGQPIQRAPRGRPRGSGGAQRRGRGNVDDAEINAQLEDAAAFAQRLAAAEGDGQGEEREQGDEVLLQQGDRQQQTSPRRSPARPLPFDAPLPGDAAAAGAGAAPPVPDHPIPASQYARAHDPSPDPEVVAAAQEAAHRVISSGKAPEPGAREPAHRWTPDEEAALEEAMKAHSTAWTDILDDPVYTGPGGALHWLSLPPYQGAAGRQRAGFRLKDKARNLRAKRARQGVDLGVFAAATKYPGNDGLQVPMALREAAEKAASTAAAAVMMNRRSAQAAQAAAAGVFAGLPPGMGLPMPLDPAMFAGLQVPSPALVQQPQLGQQEEQQEAEDEPPEAMAE